MNPINLNHINRRTLLAASLVAPWPVWSQSGTSGLVLTSRPLVFPRDHGTHNETRTEWWYLTGHAMDGNGRAFGFQVTFFRSRVDPAQPLRSRLAAKHLLFAHAAITDVQGNKLWHDQQMARWNGEPPLQRERGVFASETDTQVVLRDWSLVRDASGAYQARLGGDNIRIEISASPTQPLLLQGDQGFSRKGPDPSQASFYVSHPQLAVSGTLGLKGQTFRIASGRAWLDHEWSEALMHPDAVGWDWIGMNLDNGDSLTAFRLRRQDGSPLWAGGSFRLVDRSQAQSYAPGDLDFTPLRHWTSPRTRARYPVDWRVRTPQGVYTVKALVDAQELDGNQSTGTVYWEGLSDLLDSQGRRVGRGYLEMTGYAQRLVL